MVLLFTQHYTRSARLHSLLPLNNKNKTKHRFLIDKLCFNTYHIRQGVRTGTEPWVGPVTCSDKKIQIKINAPQAPKAPQLVFPPCGESRVAERSISSSQHKLPRPRTRTSTSGKYTRIWHAGSSTTKLDFDIYNHQKQVFHWQWYKYQRGGG